MDDGRSAYLDGLTAVFPSGNRIRLDHLTPGKDDVIAERNGVEAVVVAGVTIAARASVVRDTFAMHLDEDGNRRIRHMAKRFDGEWHRGVGSYSRAEADTTSLWAEYLLWSATQTNDGEYHTDADITVPETYGVVSFVAQDDDYDSEDSEW